MTAALEHEHDVVEHGDGPNSAGVLVVTEVCADCGHVVGSYTTSVL